MDTLKGIFDCECFPMKFNSNNHALLQQGQRLTSVEKQNHNAYIPEKSAIYHPEKNPITTQDAATAIFTALLKAEKQGHDLDVAVQDIVAQAGGWYERLAVKVLAALEIVLKDGSPLRGAIDEALKKAQDAAAGIVKFTKDHPYYTAAICTVIALGVLVILAPTLIHALGFGVLGPIEGSWAAAWQSMYGGAVESGSLFAYLQSLGMLWV